MANMHEYVTAKSSDAACRYNWIAAGTRVKRYMLAEVERAERALRAEGNSSPSEHEITLKMNEMFPLETNAAGETVSSGRHMRDESSGGGLLSWLFGD
jgi:hypothetical protein